MTGIRAKSKISSSWYDRYMRSKKIKIGTLVLAFVIILAGVLILSERIHETGIPQKKTAQQTTTTDTTPSFDKTARSTTDPASSWVVLNKLRPLNPLTYAPTDLTSVGGGQSLRADAATAFAGLVAAAKQAGYSIQPLSGYRSYQTQVAVYNNEVKANGKAQADSQSARPGYSEHQSGWAIDVGGGGCGIEDCFGTTAEGKWLAANAYLHGFIIRYPEGKQSVTGYRPEPWHIRFVGTELSTEMHTQGISTLEEFFDLPAAPDYN